MKIIEQLQKTKKAGLSLVGLTEQAVNQVLLDVADTIGERADEILAANNRDLSRMDINDPKYDRLLLNKDRLLAIAADMRTVASLAFPLGNILEQKTLENRLALKKISVPLGVVGIIYEARPNVTFDVFSLCFKSGNACVLKGGSDAKDSNEAIVRLIHSVLEKHNIDKSILYLAPADRESVGKILHTKEYIDIIIPRGSQQLIDFVRENAKVPVIETGAGIVHTYFDISGDLQKAAAIVFNAKTRRPSVCNALDTLLMHVARLQDIPELVEKLQEKKVEIFADEKSFEMLQNKYPQELLKKAAPEHFGTEFLSLKMSVKVVDSAQQAIEHIAMYSSKHSEAIIAEDKKTIDDFFLHVDAAAVYANTSTAFTDGAMFGLGAEIGISTQKLHARGPMGLRELTSYKWIVSGDGQIRP